MEEAIYPEESFDALVLVFAHFPAEDRRNYHRRLSSFLRKGGHLILEGFSRNHTEKQSLNPNAGGPKDPSMRYDVVDLEQDFGNFDFIEASEVETELNEGLYHSGESSVIRIFATKK